MNRSAVLPNGLSSTKQRGEPFRVRDAGGADEDGLAHGVRVENAVDGRTIALAGAPDEPVGLVPARARHVRRHRGDTDTVVLGEALGGLHGGTAHPNERAIALGYGLYQRLIEDPGPDSGNKTLLHLDRGVQTVGPSLPWCDAAAAFAQQRDGTSASSMSTASSSSTITTSRVWCRRSSGRRIWRSRSRSNPICCTVEKTTSDR
jgi:hypothetical protein